MGYHTGKPIESVVYSLSLHGFGQFVVGPKTCIDLPFIYMGHMKPRKFLNCKVCKVLIYLEVHVGKKVLTSMVPLLC